MSEKSESTIPDSPSKDKGAIKGNLKHGHAKGGVLSLTYQSWCCMKRRCYDQNFAGYSRYGARGITVHPTWIDSFQKFLNDVGERPTKDHSLDRFPNKNGNYEPGNVRWATAKEQSNNKTTNRLLSFRGEERTVSQWADGLGISDKALRDRIKRGWSLEEALSTKLNQHPKVWPRRIVKSASWPIQS